MYPIVLSHGIARFSALPKALGWDDVYFKNVCRHLQKAGLATYESNVSFAASVERRAEDLRQEVERIRGESGASKVHIIGHSMGGLDARHMIVDLDMAAAVASLTTIGTPHWGSSFADHVLANKTTSSLLSVLKHLGVNLEGLASLSPAACFAFNQRAEPHEAANDIHYIVYAAHQQRQHVLPLLRPSWDYIQAEEGDNDGLVAVESQLWTETLDAADGSSKTVLQRHFPVAADHLNECAWWDPSELSGLRFWEFWRVSLALRVRRYETQIRNIYLSAALEAQTLVANGP